MPLVRASSSYMAYWKHYIGTLEFMQPCKLTAYILRVIVISDLGLEALLPRKTTESAVEKLPEERTLLVRAPDQKMNSIEWELARAGIATIPIDYVDRHKRKALRETRGNLRHIAPFTTPLFQGIAMATLAPLFEWIGRQMSLSSRVVLALWFGTLAGLFATAEVFVEPERGWVLLLTLPMVAVTTIGLLRGVVGRTLDKLWSYWETTPIEDWGSVPKERMAIVRSALAIPGTRAVVEHLQRDPFVAIVRGIGPFRQKAYVTAWATGDPLLDSFAV